MMSLFFSKPFLSPAITHYPPTPLHTHPPSHLTHSYPHTHTPPPGVQPFPFGTAMITSVGMLGLDLCFVPHTPFARVPIILMVGSISKKPVVDVEGKVVVRDILPVTFTVDHRFLDGVQGAVMAKKLRLYIEQPALLDKQ